MGAYVQAYTLYSSVRPFGITAIVCGWDSEKELQVDGQVGFGPAVGAGGKQAGGKHGGPFLYMIEPSGLYWVSLDYVLSLVMIDTDSDREITGLLRRSNRQRPPSCKVGT